MATKPKKARVAKQPVSEQDQVQEQGDKGYSGTGDYQSGKLTSSDPAQATPEQIKQDRERQRNSY